MLTDHFQLISKTLPHKLKLTYQKTLALGTKRVRMMPGSKIVLPYSDADGYSGSILRDTISCIAKGMNYRPKVV